jgi:anti-sigma regulatory factor (Ser/Thr protein kinase)
VSAASRVHPGFSHPALFYRSPAEYLVGIRSFVEEGLGMGQAALVAVPGRQGALVRRSLAGSPGPVQFIDMIELGRNPGRIIPAVTEFLAEQGGRPARFVGETIWPGRTVHEVAEATRHESLINLALTAYPISVLCPYNVDGLSADSQADVWRTHPDVIVDGQNHQSSDFVDSATFLADARWALPPVPTDSTLASYPFDELSGLRHQVEKEAEVAGLSGQRVDDLVLAVHEIAGNSILYGGGRGVLQLWRDDPDMLVCEIRDAGRITDPLVGLDGPGPNLDAHGLWLVHQLCDLVEVRSGPGGTQVRIRMEIGVRASAP